MTVGVGNEAPFRDRRPLGAHLQRRVRVGACVALALAGLAVSIGVPDVQATFPGENGRIAFAVNKWRPADPCLPDPHGCEPVLVSSTIETILPSGRGRRLLFTFPRGSLASDSAGSWSPNGKLLAFQQAGRLAIIRRDGTGLRQLPQFTDWDSGPAWSPDGRRLAFAGGGPTWLFTVRPDGTALRRVMAQQAFSPAWSVSGAIAFVHRFDRYAKPVSAKDGLYSIRPDGSRLRRLFGPGSEPDWSPAGKRVAFDASGQIFTIRADGRALRRLTAFKQERDISHPVWSPDGRYIAFGRSHDLYVMRANGHGVRRVVDASSLLDLDQPDRPWSEVGVPSWQPLPR